ncbi:hypothetical protein NL676_000261 [Syzygium grande]|nr:hypothetical protein NL676_000261 [Syzygium grande]
MASSFCNLALLALAIAFCVQGTLGDIACENLDHGSCAFAVSSTGKRCVLEKQDYIETDECIAACGLDRKTLGVSSDSLLESHFTQKLCSSGCSENCPNIVDLYFSLAAGEGVFLPKLCEAQRGIARRGMAEIRSSGDVAPGPIQPVKFIGVTPAMAPSY